MTQTEPLPRPPQLYRGTDSCDLVPDWCDTDPDLLALLRACHAADPDELTPQLALADLLGDRGDARETWVRVGCELWAACRELAPDHADWDFDQAKAALEPVCRTAAGWRLACLWGCLVAYHCPAGWGGQRMGETWVDARVGAVNRCVWWWSFGFVRNGQAFAAGSQADAAGRQAFAAWSQAFAAGSQASAAGSQAFAARSQASAAWSQAFAAVWSFARLAWELCLPKLGTLA